MSEQSTAADAWLHAVAGFGLDGTPARIEVPSGDELVSGASRHRLLGVVAAGVAQGSVSLSADDLARVTAGHEAAMREVLLLEEVLLEASAVLTDAGVDHRVLKGAALAHMIHPDPAERCFGDNDILVGAADIDRALAALHSTGATRPVPPLSRSFDRRFAKSVTLGWSGDTELDLHRTLAAGPFGFLIELSDLFRDPAELLLAGRAMPTLPADLHLLHGALHVALGDVAPRLGNVRDVALLAAWPSVDVDRVIDTAVRWGCAAPVAVGLAATTVLGHRRSPVEQWADDYEVTELETRRLAVYRERSGRFRRQARASLGVLGWRDRVGFARALAWPSAANRAARGRGRRGVRPTG